MFLRVYEPVSFVRNSNSKTYLTLTNSVPVIYVSISDSKVQKLPKEVNEILKLSLSLDGQI